MTGRSRALGLAAAIGLVVGLCACGGGDDILYIKGWDFGTDRLELTVGQEHKINVNLNQAAGALTYVDITEENNEFVIVSDPDSLVLKYKAGDWTNSATIRGLKDTNDQYWKITFSLRDSNESRSLSVRVNSEKVPDLGPTPVPTPDTMPWPQPDSSSTPGDGPVPQDAGPAGE